MPTKTATRPTVADLQAKYNETQAEAARLRQVVLDEPLTALALAPERQLLEVGARYLQEAIAQTQAEEDAATREVRTSTLKASAARLADELDQLTDDVEVHTNTLLALAPEIAHKRREFAQTRKALLELDADVDARYTPLANRYRSDSGLSHYLADVKAAITACGASVGAGM